MQHIRKNKLPLAPLLRPASSFESLGLYLRHVRAHRRVSMADVRRTSRALGGDMEGLSAHILSKIESGSIRNPRATTAVKIAHAYGVQIAELAAFF